jgi:hypothetical protein
MDSDQNPADITGANALLDRTVTDLESLIEREFNRLKQYEPYPIVSDMILSPLAGLAFVIWDIIGVVAFLVIDSTILVLAADGRQVDQVNL